MCGLAGILAAKVTTTDRLLTLVHAMTGRLCHRGPDAEGFWADEGIALGHRRLAIIDLTRAGGQPMVSACGRYVVAFNGEIYNHLVVREELERVGAAPTWRGHSDTETLLAGICHWGLDEALRRSHGMFALAVWDKLQRRLWLSRDRMGEKPLYWGWADGAVIFGSELKALRAYPDFKSEVCPKALVQYLRFGYVPAPRSIHPTVYKVEPGCIVEIAGRPPSSAPNEPLRPGDRYETVSIRGYWSLNDALCDGRRAPFTDEAMALTAVEEALETAIARQMTADVPLGAFLSGGVDSSLIVALMQKQSSRPVKTFTVAFEDRAFNEAPHAAEVARHLGTDHCETMVTDREAREVVPLMSDVYDEPFADHSQIPTYLVCRAARREVTVALSGDAGDELFGGYNRYFWAPQIQRRFGWVPWPARHLAGQFACGIPEAFWDTIALASAKLGGPRISRAGYKVHKLGSRLGDVHSTDRLYRSVVSLWDQPTKLVRSATSEPKSNLDDLLPDGFNGNASEWMMIQDMRTYLPDDILCKVDRAAMAVSLETRVPFLDPAVLAVSARLPVAMKIEGTIGKLALREILYRYVPRRLVERPKAGFAVPLCDWLRGPLRTWAEDMLAPSQLASAGMVDPGPVSKIWAEHLSGRRDWTDRLWSVLMLQAWHERLQ